MNRYVYLAGSSAELPRVKAMVKRIEELNAEMMFQGDAIVLTHNWWDLVEELGANPEAESHVRRAWAEADLQGVKEAEIFLCLWPENPTGSGGCIWEAGYADALDTEMIFAGPTKRSIFPSRGSEFEADEAAFEYLRDLCYNDFDMWRAEAAMDIERSG